MLRFVILVHDFPTPHFDFMLETPATLRTWRLTPPAGVPIPDVSAENFDRCHGELLPDHRRIYLEYEGPVSGNRGCVVRWDAGHFQWLADTDDRVSVQLEGDRIAGVVTLLRSKSGAWNLTYQPDQTPD